MTTTDTSPCPTPIARADKPVGLEGGCSHLRKCCKKESKWWLNKLALASLEICHLAFLKMVTCTVATESAKLPLNLGSLSPDKHRKRQRGCGCAVVPYVTARSVLFIKGSGSCPLQSARRGPPFVELTASRMQQGVIQ